jgi:glycopeptide antibiotics resistance protein
MGFIPPLVLGRRTKPWHAALFGLSLSLVIEGGQYVSGRRVTDVDDLFLNTLGGVLGYFSASGLLGLSARTHRRTSSDQSRPTPSESATRLM